MNEQIKELAEQAGFEKQTHLIDSWECGLKELERFAELVRADEREACATLCDLFSQSSANVPSRYEFMGESAQECAKLIRARGEPNPSFKNYMGDNWAGIV